MDFIRPLLPIGRAEEINKKLILFLNKIVEAVEAFNLCLKNFCSGDMNGIKEDVKKIDALETQADNIRREIEKSLHSEGLISFKEDKIILLEKIDDMADRAEIASWDMDIFAVKLPKELSALLLKCGSALVELAKTVKLCVASLNIDIKTSLEHAKSVERQRNEIRKIIHELRHKIFLAKLDCRTLTLLTDLCYRMMRIADAAEEAADRASTMAIKIA